MKTKTLLFLAVALLTGCLSHCNTTSPSSSPVYQDVAGANGSSGVVTLRGMDAPSTGGGSSRHQKAQAQSEAFFGQ